MTKIQLPDLDKIDKDDFLGKVIEYRNKLELGPNNLTKRTRIETINKILSFIN